MVSTYFRKALLVITQYMKIDLREHVRRLFQKAKSSKALRASIIVSAFAFFLVVGATGWLVYALFDRLWLNPPVEPTIVEQVGESKRDVTIQLNILNATETPGLARRLVDYLRLRGFDVVEIGNYDSTIAQSIVLDRIGLPTASRQVAYALGISDSLVSERVDTSLFLHSTVVLGRDYSSLKPFAVK